MRTQFTLSIGTNLGDRAANLRQAVRWLAANPAIQVERLSAIYETEPVGGVVQPAFYNLALVGTTILGASELLAYLHLIERSLHRRRLVHWGPRTIDLDILTFGDRHYDTATLTIPHPEMANRRFVLVPLATVVSGDQQAWVEQLLAKTSDHNWLKKTIESGEVNSWIKNESPTR